VDDSAPQPPLLLRFYGEYLECRRSADFIQSVSLHYNDAALQRLTSAHDRNTRRAAVLALGLTADYTANHALGRALADDDRLVRVLAENGLRAVWRRQGSIHQRRQIGRLIRLNRSGEYDAAITHARTLIRLAPWIAEVWRQKGAAHFHLGAYHTALSDFEQTLELNAYHFEAAVGMAYCRLSLHEPVAALKCFGRALQLNPNLEGVRAQMNRLHRALRGLS
jgi:tetratricopeptide (TPR) repeat protein